MRVRIARPDDYDALCALFDELDAFHRRARPEMFGPFEGPGRSREQVERWLGGSDSTVLAADGVDGVVGLAVLLTRPPSAFAGALARKVIEVDNLVVRTEWRGQGVGRDLLDAALDWSRRQGATHLEVAVHAFNRDARRFYEGFGFAPSIDRLMLTA